VLEYLINVKPLFVAYFLRPDEGMIVRYVQPLTNEQRALLEKTMKEQYLCQLGKAEGGLRGMNTAQAGDLVENLGK